MGAWKDLKGIKFGKLIPVKYLGDRKWECVCECGNSLVVFTSNLIRQHSKSCGCAKSSMITASKIKHNLRNSPVYNIWKGIRKRCLNSKDGAWPFYGGRGIGIDPAWLEFQPFHEWALQTGYRQGLTLERIDNNKDYGPLNCCWISQSQQSKNRRSNIIVNGLCLKDYCEKHSLNYRAIRARIGTYKWSIEKAIKTPIRSHYKVPVITVTE